VTIPSGTTAVQVVISSVTFRGGAGTILQVSSMSVQCREQDQLELLSTYGSLQLTGFKNVEIGSQQVFAYVEITYTATNSGTFDANLLTATVTSPFSGRYEALPNGAMQLARPSDSEAFTESFLLNLSSISGSSYEFDFQVGGEGTQSGLACSEDTSYSLQVD